MNRPDVLRDIANALGMLADLGGFTYTIWLAPRPQDCAIYVKGPHGLSCSEPVFPLVGLAMRLDTARSWILYNEDGIAQ